MNWISRRACCSSVLDTIGATPLIALSRLSPEGAGLVLLKMESLNPGGSVKDRIALRMIEAAERQGLLEPGDIVVELTSGNTGIGLATVCAVKGYRFIAVMSAGNSVERRRMLAALGAEVEVVPQAAGSRSGQVSGEDLALVEERASALAADLDAYRPDQFFNPQNPLIHEEATGEEIWDQCGGDLAGWTATVGTGGTFVGVARALKRHNPEIRAIAVEPAGAQVLAGHAVVDPAHRLQGAGYAAVPHLWDATVCDGTIGIGDEVASVTARQLSRREGIFAGFTTGANVAAALRLAVDLGPDQRVATVCCDTGLRYLSTDLVPR